MNYKYRNNHKKKYLGYQRAKQRKILRNKEISAMREVKEQKSAKQDDQEKE